MSSSTAEATNNSQPGEFYQQLSESVRDDLLLRLGCLPTVKPTPENGLADDPGRAPTAVRCRYARVGFSDPGEEKTVQDDIRLSNLLLTAAPADDPRSPLEQDQADTLVEQSGPDNTCLSRAYAAMREPRGPPTTPPSQAIIRQWHVQDQHPTRSTSGVPVLFRVWFRWPGE